MSTNKIIKTFHDLRVYQNIYKAMVLVMTKVIVDLPRKEKFDLISQTSRACKAGLALIAEWFARRYQKRNWRKYIDDAIEEFNEMIHHLSVCVDIYFDYTDIELCNKLIDLSDYSCRQSTNFKKVWQNFHENEK